VNLPKPSRSLCRSVRFWKYETELLGRISDSCVLVVLQLSQMQKAVTKLTMICFGVVVNSRLIESGKIMRTKDFKENVQSW